MGVKVAIYTVGTWPGQVEMLTEKLTARNIYVGKFTGEDRLLQAVGKGAITHLMVTQESALNAPTITKLKSANVQVLTFGEVGKII